MPFPPPAGRCVHCLIFHDKLTWDHVFPEAWYPNSTPENLERWKIPSCESCNAAHGRSENELMLRIGLCLDPESTDSAGVVPRALRAIDPAAGRNERDTAVRTGKRRRLLAQTESILSRGMPRESIYPGFGPVPGLATNEHIPVALPKRSIEQIVEKIVRGLTYIEDRKFIEPTHVIESHVLREDAACDIRQMLSQFGKSYVREPGLRVERAVTPDDGVSSFYRIEIWGRFVVYASVVQLAGAIT